VSGFQFDTTCVSHQLKED